MTVAADVLNVARSYIGVAEDPPHSNRTIIGEKFGWNGVAWCAESVTVWQHEAGNTSFAGSASCSVLVGRYQDGTNGTWVSDPDAGDEGFLGSHGQDHTFLVEANNGDGSVTTIEGNWADRVTRVHRSISSIYGFGRPNYDGQVGNAVSATGGRPELRLGSRGDSVAEWQKCVGPAVGQAIAVDGDFGPATETATIAFQTAQNLGADGVVGPATYAVMDQVLAFVAGLANNPDQGVPAFPGECQEHDKGAAVRAFQQRFADRGWSIRVDGQFGPRTKAVAVAYQTEKGLTVDGICGEETWNSLWTAPVN